MATPHKSIRSSFHKKKNSITEEANKNKFFNCLLNEIIFNNRKGKTVYYSMASALLFMICMQC